MTLKTPTQVATHRIGFTADNLRAIVTCAKCGQMSIPFPCQHCGSTEFRKTQTRRLVKAIKLHPDYGKPDWDDVIVDGSPTAAYLKVAFDGNGDPQDRTRHRHYPRWGAGDRLALTEGYRICETNGRVVRCEYSLDFATREVRLTDAEAKKFYARKKPWAWTPSRYMYNSLIRLFAETTGVGAERVQEISIADCEAEGIDLAGEHAELFAEAERANSAGLSCGCRFPEIYPFACLWDSINLKRGHGWDKNDWVWPIRFERIAND